MHRKPAEFEKACGDLQWLMGSAFVPLRNLCHAAPGARNEHGAGTVSRLSHFSGEDFRFWASL